MSLWFREWDPCHGRSYELKGGVYIYMIRGLPSFRLVENAVASCFSQHQLAGPYVHAQPKHTPRKHRFNSNQYKALALLHKVHWFL